MKYELLKQGTEILRVTPEGEFIWHPDADRLLEEEDFSNSPALPYILRKLRQAREWVGLTDEDIMQAYDQVHGFNVRFEAFARVLEAKLKEKNHG